jgi:hypothetical protein
MAQLFAPTEGKAKINLDEHSGRKKKAHLGQTLVRSPPVAAKTFI